MLKERKLMVIVQCELKSGYKHKQIIIYYNSSNKTNTNNNTKNLKRGINVTQKEYIEYSINSDAFLQSFLIKCELLHSDLIFFYIFESITTKQLHNI